jgi:hypothetical protein
VPSSHRGIKCVIVDPALRSIEPMAYAFVLNFARDNDLLTEPLTSERPSDSDTQVDRQADDSGRPT